MSKLTPPDDPAPSAQAPSSDGVESPQQKLHLMLAGIWERSKKTVAERIAILRQAGLLAAKGELDEPARLRAVDAAHKLAGVLGTFGLPRGTDLAREAEEAFGQTTAMSQAQVTRLISLVDELETLIKTAGPSTRS